MLNKPFFLTLLLIAISFGLSIILGLILVVLGLKNNTGMSSAIPIFAALYVGQIYANKYKVELQKNEKIKIALYYFLIQILLLIGVLVIFPKITIANPIILVSIFLGAFISLLIYFNLGFGCRTKLKASEKNLLLKAQMMADPVYAESVITEVLTSNKTDLLDVRYCQHCGAEFSANEAICPICEKLND